MLIALAPLMYGNGRIDQNAETQSNFDHNKITTKNIAEEEEERREDEEVDEEDEEDEMRAKK